MGNGLHVFGGALVIDGKFRGAALGGVVQGWECDDGTLEGVDEVSTCYEETVCGDLVDFVLVHLCCY